MRRRPLRLGCLALWVLAGPVAVASCQAQEEDQVVRVFAASSLQDVVPDLVDAFRTRHPDARVVVSYAGSQILRLQIEGGAPADVFASAHPEHVEAMRARGLIAESMPFARTEVVAVTPVANPARLESFSDLPRARRIVMGTPEVPAGRYARTVLERMDSLHAPGFAQAVLAQVVSQEPNVRLVRAKVALGEADAAFVYASDATSIPELTVFKPPPDVAVEARYVSAVIAGPPDQLHTARLWNAWLGSEAAQAVLRRHGFSPAAP